VVEISVLRDLVSKGYTRHQIAEAIGYSYNRTGEVLRENGIDVKHEAKGKKREKRDLKECCDRTQEIVSLRKSGLSYNQIANKVGVNKSQISTVCRRFGLGDDGKPHTLNIDAVASVVCKAGFDYIGGYENSKKPVLIRCRVCGAIFRKRYNNVANSLLGLCKVLCPECKKQEQELIKQGRQAARQAQQQAQREAQSKRMAERNSREVNNSLTRRLANHVCKTCGRTFCIELTGYNSTNYCSKLCQTAKYRKQHDRKRIARMYSKQHDNDITLKKLYQRDNGACYICGRQCDWYDFEKTDKTIICGDSYPSIDHVIPLSKGGLHVWGNVKLCCRACNTVKGAEFVDSPGKSTEVSGE